MEKLRFFAKIAAMVAFLAFVWYFLHGEVYAPYLNSLFPASTAFILQIVIAFVSSGTFMVAFIYFLFKKESKINFRSFFKIERLDVKGIWLALALGLIVQVINVAFLYTLLLEPARNFLISLGLSGGKIGVGSGEIVPLLSPFEATFLTAFLLLFWWVEVPEELFFRGYIQNKAQDVIGKNAAMFLSAFLWDITHLFGLVNLVERFIYGLVYGFIFRSECLFPRSLIAKSVSIRHPWESSKSSLGNSSVTISFHFVLSVWMLTPSGSAFMNSISLFSIMNYAKKAGG